MTSNGQPEERVRTCKRCGIECLTILGDPPHPWYCIDCLPYTIQVVPKDGDADR